MADQPATRAALLELFADGRFGGISAGDLRRFVATFGVGAAISVFEASTQQDNVGTDGTTVLTCWDTDDYAEGMVADQANNRLVAQVAGYYSIECHLQFSGTGSGVFKMTLNVNSVEQSYRLSRKMSAAGDVGSASFVAPFVMLNAGDELKIHVESDNANDDVTVWEGTFSARLVG